MEVTFLGTGTSQGVPVIGCDCEVCTSSDPKDNRLRTSVHLQIGTLSVVIDTGPDFRTQMLRENINSLDAVLFTHEHKDHIAGFDDIRPFYFLQAKAMDVYATTRVQNALKKAFDYIFEEYRYPGVPEVNLHTISDKPFLVNGVEFIPLPVMHKNLPVTGFRVGDFTYITDASYIYPEVLHQVKYTKVLVLNALRIQSHYSHFNLEEALRMIEVIQPEEAYLIHIAHSLGLHEKVENALPKGVHLSYDGLKLQL